MFTVYVIQNNLGYIYIGQTSNLMARLDRHNGIKKNKSKSFTSKHAGPWNVVYSESYSSRAEALHREKELKSYQGREYVKKIIARAHSSVGRSASWRTLKQN